MTNPKGNPRARERGEVVRAILMGLVATKPKPMCEVMELTGRSRTRILDHLALLQEKRRIAGYSSAGGVLRVWMKERE